MIDVRIMNNEWLHLNARTMHGDPLLLEKATRALLMVQGLAESGLEFVFKGGTALLLLLSKPARFSIDADILLPGRMSIADIALMWTHSSVKVISHAANLISGNRKGR